MLAPFHLDIAFPEQVIQASRSRFFHNLWLPIQVSRRDPQPLFPLHNHDFDEIAYILKGHGVSFMAQFQLLLPGNIVYLRAADTHAYPMVDHLVLVNIFFDHARLNHNFPKMHELLEDFYRLQSEQSRLFTNYPVYARLRALANQLDLETLRADEYSEYSALAHLVEFLVLVLRQYRQPDAVRPLEGDEISRGKALLVFSDPALPQVFDREALRALVGRHGLAWRSFERLLPELAGLTPHELCTCNRIIRFLNLLLEDPGRNLEEASEQAGFADYRSMARNCQAAFGLSPKQIRERVGSFVAAPPEAPPVREIACHPDGRRPGIAAPLPT
ncbi:helix-turn-helix transcriptional regulator [Tropicimonas sp. IMCC34043]|uniref:AraC family transcriptional regulator n=1 Tax=Tropicimonas sp. IMCC34043 TaxID=2248760 RepID=UPI000E252F75|nr:helix-turn-helix transcriptional regulator [Tropicimonas sp. IMCC34043]